MLEDELRSAVHDQESRMFFQIRGKRIEFERSVKAAHRKLKTNFFRWLVTNRPRNLITGPLIYGMVIPLEMLDLCVSFYQWACLPIYGISKVKRGDYLVFDRRHLGYLNFIEKFHCTHCEYGNGLMNDTSTNLPFRKKLGDERKPICSPARRCSFTRCRWIRSAMSALNRRMSSPIASA